MGPEAAAVRVAFVTCRGMPGGTRDDRIAAEACAARGLDVVSVPWDDEGVDWSGFSAIVVRSTWDYQEKAALFIDWIDHLAGLDLPVFNDPETLRWNLRKSYLLDLAPAGVPVPPTAWLNGPADVDGARIAAELGSHEWVVKPVLGAGGRGAFRARADRSDDLARMRAAAESEPVLVQPFLPEITSRGECSLIYFGGKYSHAARKTPVPGNFRVHEERGGTRRAEEPSERVREIARTAMDELDRVPLYARVDLVEAEDGPFLMELELVEPALYFGDAPGSEERFADALVGVLEAGRPWGAGEGDLGT